MAIRASVVAQSTPSHGGYKDPQEFRPGSRPGQPRALRREHYRDLWEQDRDLARSVARQIG